MRVLRISWQKKIVSYKRSSIIFKIFKTVVQNNTETCDCTKGKVLSEFLRLKSFFNKLYYTKYYTVYILEICTCGILCLVDFGRHVEFGSHMEVFGSLTVEFILWKFGVCTLRLRELTSAHLPLTLYRLNYV